MEGKRMTREEAAEVLLKLRHDLKVERGGIYERMTPEQQRDEDALDEAITALRQGWVRTAGRVPNCGTETRQIAECAWCDPNQDVLQFRISWWTRSLFGKHRWFSVTEHHKAKYCSMCARKLEAEG